MAATRSGRSASGGEVIGIRTLGRNAEALIDDIVVSGRPKLVTRSGRAAALIQPIDNDSLIEAFSGTPEVEQARRRGLADMAAGRVFSQEEVARDRAARGGAGSPRKKATSRKAVSARKTTAKKTTARKTAAKKTTARKTAAKKTTARKAASARKSTARKSTARKSTGRRSTR